MKPEIKAMIQGTIASAVAWAMIFVGAGTLEYWQGWALLAVSVIGSIPISSVLLRDRELLQRRMNIKEREAGHMALQILLILCFVASISISLTDYRRAFSAVPVPVNAIGDLSVAAGFLTFYAVLRLNRFASATIEVAQDQRVISTGIYAYVRHPWYIGLILLFVGMPLALGSYWGLLVLLPILAMLVWRLLSEEHYLTEHLVGYSDYLEKVRWRLLPGVF